MKKATTILLMLIFIQGFAQETFRSDGKFGFKNADGTVFIEPQFDYAYEFRENRALVQNEGLWGFVDRTGKVVIPIKYTRAGEFNDSTALIYKDGYYGSIGYDGKVIIPPEFDRIGNVNFHGDHIQVFRNGKMGLVKLPTYELVVPPKYDKASYLNNTYQVYRGDDYGMLDSAGNQFIPIKASGYPRSFSRSGVRFYRYRIDDKYGIATAANPNLIPPRYEKSDIIFPRMSKQQNPIIAKRQNSHTVIGLKPPHKKMTVRYWIIPSLERPFIYLKEKEDYFLYNHDLKRISREPIQPFEEMTYKHEEYPHGNILKILPENWFIYKSVDNLYGAVDFTGDSLIEPRYSELVFENGLFVGKSAETGKYHLINRKAPQKPLHKTLWFDWQYITITNEQGERVSQLYIISQHGGAEGYYRVENDEVVEVISPEFKQLHIIGHWDEYVAGRTKGQIHLHTLTGQKIMAVDSFSYIPVKKVDSYGEVEDSYAYYLAKRDGKWQLLTDQGTDVTWHGPEFDEYKMMEHDLFYLRKADKYALALDGSQLLTPFKYDSPIIPNAYILPIHPVTFQSTIDGYPVTLDSSGMESPGNANKFEFEIYKEGFFKKGVRSFVKHPQKDTGKYFNVLRPIYKKVEVVDMASDEPMFKVKGEDGFGLFGIFGDTLINPDKKKVYMFSGEGLDEEWITVKTQKNKIGLYSPFNARYILEPRYERIGQTNLINELNSMYAYEFGSWLHVYTDTGQGIFDLGTERFILEPIYQEIEQLEDIIAYKLYTSGDKVVIWLPSQWRFYEEGKEFNADQIPVDEIRSELSKEQ